MTVKDLMQYLAHLNPDMQVRVALPATVQCTGNYPLDPDHLELVQYFPPATKWSDGVPCLMIAYDN
jgi:hypothetical protein